MSAIERDIDLELKPRTFLDATNQKVSIDELGWRKEKRSEEQRKLARLYLGFEAEDSRCARGRCVR